MSYLATAQTHDMHIINQLRTYSGALVPTEHQPWGAFPVQSIGAAAGVDIVSGSAPHANASQTVPR